MHHFAYRDGVLHCEDVNLERLAAEAGTPLYVYSTATLTRHVQVFRKAFRGHSIDVFYAMKANGNAAVIRTIARAGAGADTVSEGEIRKAMHAGVPADRIVFSGVGKTPEEMAFAVETGIHQINVETPHELEVLDAIARARGKRAPVVFRVNPDVGAGGHAKITTGSDDNKFGISFTDIDALYARAEAMGSIEALGLAVHIGSQIFDILQLEAAFRRLATLVGALRAAGRSVTRLDLGGGIGVPYDVAPGVDTDARLVEAYAGMVLDVTNGLDVHLAFEPGRMIVGNAGVLLTRVVTLNERASKSFLVVDAGMNDLLRPAMYDAHHEIWPVRAPVTSERVVYDVVGPICESSDIFAAGRSLPCLAPGDLVAFMTAGAYGSTMSSTYNMRRLVAEALVDGARHAIVRPRQTWDELLTLDRQPPWLANA
jgi:diaminopimelate decarboxylase